MKRPKSGEGSGEWRKRGGEGELMGFSLSPGLRINNGKAFKGRRNGAECTEICGVEDLELEAEREKK